MKYMVTVVTRLFQRKYVLVIFNQHLINWTQTTLSAGGTVPSTHLRKTVVFACGDERWEQTNGHTALPKISVVISSSRSRLPRCRQVGGILTSQREIEALMNLRLFWVLCCLYGSNTYIWFKVIRFRIYVVYAWLLVSLSITFLGVFVFFFIIKIYWQLPSCMKYISATPKGLHQK